MKTLLTDLERHKMYEMSQQTLWEESDEAREALDYLRNTRKINDQVIRDFKFGYCPIRSKHDWAGRLIMPLHDPYGNVVALTTRDFRTTDKDKKPHLHEQFEKRRYLFGIDVAKKNIVRKKRAMIVEGQFDTTHLHSQGFNETVGVLGSALTFDHICILRRYCSDIYLIFDHDEAGLLSIERAIEIYKSKYLYGYDMSFVPVVLPKPPDRKKMDPDEFLKENGRDAFVAILKESKKVAIEKGLYVASA